MAISALGPMLFAVSFDKCAKNNPNAKNKVAPSNYSYVTTFTKEDFNAWKAANPDKTLVLVFGADWCLSCKALQPTLLELAGEFENKNVVFIKVEVPLELTIEENRKTRAFMDEINPSTAIPAVFVVRGNEITRVSTANHYWQFTKKAAIKEQIEKQK
ncbi:MAG: thioredoxin family protein [Candidatus Margulisiibacteriota bacterium]